MVEAQYPDVVSGEWSGYVLIERSEFISATPGAPTGWLCGSAMKLANGEYRVQCERFSIHETAEAALREVPDWIDDVILLGAKYRSLPVRLQCDGWKLDASMGP